MKLWISLLVGLAIAVAAVAVAAWSWVNRPMELAADAVEVSVEPGTSPRDVAQAWVQAGVKVSPRLLFEWFRWSGQARKIRAGNYEIARGTTPAGLLNKMVRGDETLATVRLIEGWTFSQFRAELARAEGLKPNQDHGFHIHDKGDCSSGDGVSAGGHFNPAGKPHGAHDSAERHAGDLPSLKADAAGRVDVKFELAGIAVGSGAADVVGRGLIVHAMPDDFKTQPTGNSGARIACGVITRQMS